MSKKLIIMTAAAGLIAFSGSFVFAWLTKAAPPSQIDEPNLPTIAGPGDLKIPYPEAGTLSTMALSESNTRKAIAEKQLNSLVYEVRDKIREYNNKLLGLEKQEQRLQIAQDMLKKDIENLNNLRIELAAMVARLKSERDKLIQSRVEIAEAEKANLMSIAAAYDKMEVSSASKILTNMCVPANAQAQKRPLEDGSSSTDDAVKILHYMTERTKAKLLAELVNSEPKLAAALCQRLKQIVEEK